MDRGEGRKYEWIRGGQERGEGMMQQWEENNSTKQTQEPAARKDKGAQSN